MSALGGSDNRPMQCISVGASLRRQHQPTDQASQEEGGRTEGDPEGGRVEEEGDQVDQGDTRREGEEEHAIQRLE